MFCSAVTGAGYTAPRRPGERSDAGCAVVHFAHEALELGLAAVEDVRIAREGAGVGVLPQLPAPPAARQGRRAGGAVGGEEERGVLRGPVPHHVVPPVQVRVQHGTAQRRGAVAVGEADDPLAHLLLAEPVVAGPPGVGLEVDHARQGDPVGGPAAAVVEEEVDLLLGAAGVGAGEVVAAAYQASVAGADVLLVEGMAGVGAALVGLDVGGGGAGPG